jgi:Na+/proline symporter
MSAVSLFCLVFAYFALLLAWPGAPRATPTTTAFFIGNKSSNWMLVAFGMVGTTLSGVTFISVPGAVGRDGFGYLQVILGYVLGYIAVAYILLPLYYRLKLTSIYRYLDGASAAAPTRAAPPSSSCRARWRHGAAVPGGQHPADHHPRQPGRAVLADHLVILGMILLYTYEGGVKTIVWTDTLQTTCMLLGLLICAASAA